jgi:hypothetical protein
MTSNNCLNATTDTGANPVFPDSILRVQMLQEVLPFTESAEISHSPPFEPLAVDSSFGELQHTLILIDSAIAIMDDFQLHPHDDDMTGEMVRQQ